MRLRTLLIGAGVILLAVAWWRWPASVPDAFAPLVEDLKTFERMEVVVGWPDGPGADLEATILLRSDETASVSANGASLTFDGAVKLAADGFSVPLPDLTPRAEDLYAELRRGLSRSDWEAIDPPVFGLIRPAPDAAWASVTLPFDWADGVEVLLAVDRDTGQLRYVLLSGRTAPFTASTRPIQGGLRTVQLSERAFVRLPVRQFSQVPP